MGSSFKSWFSQGENKPPGQTSDASATTTVFKGLETRSPSLPQSPPLDALSMYELLELQPGEFRVFQLDPSQDPSAPVVIHLINASLDDPPAYDALSYRWSGSNGHTITVNGAELPVTENLFLALHSLRQTSGPRPLTLWVDGICINQASIHERNEQVPLMGQIYTQAQTVRVWLGDEEPGVDAAFDLVHDCGRSQAADVVDRVLRDEAGTRALTELLHRPYWGRMWMFQEIVLAPSIVVHCGRYEVPWAHIQWLDTVTADSRLWSGHQVDNSWIGDFRESMLGIYHFSLPKKEYQNIKSVVLPTRKLACQDPRDKLYALLGVCSTLAETVKVDYAIPTREVYTDFARSQIESDKELYTLLSAGLWDPANGEDLDLPSWVPDLRGTAGFDDRYVGGAYRGVFNAADAEDGTLSFAFSERKGHSILEVEALLLDTVQTCADFAADDDGQARKALIDTFCLAADGADLSVTKLRGFFEAVAFADAIGRDAERLQRTILGFFEDLRRLYGSRLALTGFLESFEDVGLQILQRGTSDDPLDLFSGEELHRDRLEYLGRASQNSEDDRDSAVFCTAKGYIGLGSSRVVQGDVVAIIRGCRVPVVLRRYGSYLRLVGPSYVSGLMQGEAVRASRGGSDFERVQLF